MFLLSRRRWSLTLSLMHLKSLRPRTIQMPFDQQTVMHKKTLLSSMVFKKRWMTSDYGGAKKSPSLPGAFVIASTISAGLSCAYAWTLSQQNMPLSATLREAEIVFPVEPNDAFCHPYDNKPMWWRLMLISKRIFVLSQCFAPFFALTIIILFTDSKQWR